MIKYASCESSSLIPMRSPPASTFSTWISFQAFSLQFIPHCFWRARAGREPTEGADVVPRVHQREVLSSVPTEDSLNLLVGFVRSFLLLETQLRTSLSWSGFEERASRRCSVCSSKRNTMCRTPSPLSTPAGAKL